MKHWKKKLKIAIRKQSGEAVCATLQPKLSASTHETKIHQLFFTVAQCARASLLSLVIKVYFICTFFSVHFIIMKTYLCTTFELPDEHACMCRYILCVYGENESTLWLQALLFAYSRDYISFSASSQ